MRRLLIALCGTAAVLGLGGCADYGPHNYASGYGDVWYDGAYGAYPGGFWDGDVFLFRDRDGRFRRDDANHFRRERFQGAQNFRAMPNRGGMPSATQSGANASATVPQPAPATPTAPMTPTSPTTPH